MAEPTTLSSTPQTDHGRRLDVRNIAIIAHVDHGKTTLVDALLKQTGEFKVKIDEARGLRDGLQPARAGARHHDFGQVPSVHYKDHTINIVDTPGHADFGGEVERILKMVDGVLLLIDALDGPMPQTRFVLRKSLELGLNPIVVVNKVDRPFADPLKALDKTFSLFVDLGATDPQLDFPIIYASGRQGWASMVHDKPGTNLEPLFEAIVKSVPGPLAHAEKPFQMLTTIIDQNSFVGRIAIGRVSNGTITRNQPIALIKRDGTVKPGKVMKLYGFFGLSRREIEKASAGDIIALAGAEDAQVGDTIADALNPVALPTLEIDEPTLSIEFMVNDSPFCGKEGKFITTRHLRERLEKEKQTNVGLRIEELDGTNKGVFKVAGRGELHLSVLIETMRREGFELAVSRPQVIYKQEGGQTLEPAEHLVVDIESQYQGAIIENLGRRGAEIKNMAPEGRRPHADRGRHHRPRPHRLQVRVPDPNQGHRPHAPQLPRLRAQEGRARPAAGRRPGRPGDRHQHRLRPGSPPGALPALRAAPDGRLQGPDRRPERPGQRPDRQPLQEEGLDPTCAPPGPTTSSNSSRPKVFTTLEQAIEFIEDDELRSRSRPRPSACARKSSTTPSRSAVRTETRGESQPMIVKPVSRGFICTTAHPEGCAKHVAEQIAFVKSLPPLTGAKKVLVIGASTGYGLASRITAAFGMGADTLGVFFERPADDKRPASAGWYNTAAFETAAKATGRVHKSLNGDAFSAPLKEQTIDLIKQDWRVWCDLGHLQPGLPPARPPRQRGDLLLRLEAPRQDLRQQDR